MEITEEQKAIAEYGRQGKGDLLIQALAGTGKTFSLLEILKVIPQRSVLVCAFNKRIATELQDKIKALKLTRSVVNVKTFHALGLSIIKHYYKHLDVSQDATEDLVNEAAKQRGETASFNVRRAAIRLVRQVKETEIDKGFVIGANDQEFMRVGLDYELFGKCNEAEMGWACDIATTAYMLCQDPTKLTAIDFCDMVWMPIALGLAPPSRYQAVIVDEWQDLSEPQFELVQKLIAPGGRLIMAGDEFQEIYSWRGSIGSTIKQHAIERRAQILPLTTTFRCAKSIVAEANQLVPGLRALPDADEGTVTRTHIRKLANALPRTESKTIHTFVLSRDNARLLECALALWKDRVSFQLNAGQQMLDPLFQLIDGKLDTTGDAQRFQKSLGAWLGVEIAKAQKANATAYEERVREQYFMLMRASEYSKPRDIKRMLQAILSPGTSGILLSTVHKVKGLEARCVYLLEQTFERHREEHPPGDPRSGKRRWTSESPGGSDIAIELRWAPSQEELNIEYVAITRAIEHLIWVDMRVSTSKDNQIGGGGLHGKTKDQLQAMFEECEREAERLGSTAATPDDENEAARYAGRALEIKAFMEKAQ